MADIQIICDGCEKPFPYNITEAQLKDLEKGENVLRIDCPKCGASNIETFSTVSSAMRFGTQQRNIGYSLKYGVGGLAYFVSVLGYMFTDIRYVPFLLFIFAGIILTIMRPVFFFVPVILILVLSLVYYVSERPSR